MDRERGVSATGGLVVISAATFCGLLWGILTLFLLSGPPVASSGAWQPIRVVLTLPLSAAGWVSNTLGVSVIDPSALVLAAGATIGLAAGFCILAIARFREG